MGVVDMDEVVLVFPSGDQEEWKDGDNCGIVVQWNGLRYDVQITPYEQEEGLEDQEESPV